jgi:hypothetical protein
MALRGYPEMAITACFAGPMLSTRDRDRRSSVTAACVSTDSVVVAFMHAGKQTCC